MTMAAYADQLAADDGGWWRSAIQRAAGWIRPHHPTIDLTRQVPMPQLMLQAGALAVYGLARSSDTDPCTVSADELFDWVDERQLPHPPDRRTAITAKDVDELMAEGRLWRHEVDFAAARQQHDLAELLNAAGHLVPSPGHRSLKRFSADPIIATWLALVDIDPPTPGPVAVMDAFPAPLLSLGLSGLGDIR